MRVGPMPLPCPFPPLNFIPLLSPLLLLLSPSQVLELAFFSCLFSERFFSSSATFSSQLRVQQGKEDWGWGVLLRVSKRSSGETSGAGDKGGDGAGGYLLDLLLRCERTTESTGEGPPVKPCSPGKKGEMLVVNI